jgi:hypothetical protein
MRVQSSATTNEIIRLPTPTIGQVQIDAGPQLARPKA